MAEKIGAKACAGILLSNPPPPQQRLVRSE
jgi:hypothetical protein